MTVWLSSSTPVGFRCVVRGRVGDGRQSKPMTSYQPSIAPGLPPRFSSAVFAQQPTLQLIYDTAPIGLAFLSLDCRYIQINQRLTEICGISVEDHLGRSVRDCVPALADAVEGIVQSIMRTGDPVTGVEVAGQRADQADERFWVTYWHPHRNGAGEIVGVNVAAEEITERKRAEAALQASERQFHTLADSIPQLVWMADAQGAIYWLNNHWYEYTGRPAGEVNPHGWQAIFGDRWIEALANRRGAGGGAFTAREGRPVSSVPDPRRSAPRFSRHRLWLDRHPYRHQRAQAQRAGGSPGKGRGRSRVATSAGNPEFADRGREARRAWTACRRCRARDQQSAWHQPDSRLIAGAKVHAVCLGGRAWNAQALEPERFRRCRAGRIRAASRQPEPGGRTGPVVQAGGGRPK